MKQFKIFVFAAIAIAVLPSCSDDDTIVPVNEEEVITTVTATFIPAGGGTPVVLTSRDLDGDSGPDAPVVTISGDFTAGTAYSGSVSFLNELQTPAGNITEEVEEEGTEHQVFFVVTNGNIGTFTYTDEDANGDPVGLHFTYTAVNNAATGTLSIVLVHEPQKDAGGVSGGDIANAEGNTDAEVRFPVIVAVP